MDISCSNNKLAKDVLSGLKRIGTRYECLRKGFGEGYYNGKSDTDYTEVYEPITIDKFYCGTKLKLPKKYNRFGTLPDCLRKGWTIGMQKKQKESKKKSIRKKSTKKSKKKSIKKSKRKSTKKSKRKLTKKSIKKSKRKS